jgi:hypothetical protein
MRRQRSPVAMQQQQSKHQRQVHSTFDVLSGSGVAAMPQLC